MDNIISGDVKNLNGCTPEELAHYIYDVLEGKKAKDIKIVKVSDKTVIADYFVLANGTSSTHVQSLEGEVEYKLGLCGVNPAHVEGRDSNSWMVIDYSNVIVHIFDREAREFYNLDKLYTDI